MTAIAEVESTTRKTRRTPDDIGGDEDPDDDHDDDSDQDVDTDTDTDMDMDMDDDDSDSDENEEEDDDDDDDESDGDDDSDEEYIPKPEEVELECTYPRDFVGRSWEEVVRGQFFRLILDPSCAEIAIEKFRDCPLLIELVVPTNSVLTWIRRLAFHYCKNLQQITNGLPETLLMIDDYAFA